MVRLTLAAIKRHLDKFRVQPVDLIETNSITRIHLRAMHWSPIPKPPRDLAISTRQRLPDNPPVDPDHPIGHKTAAESGK